MTVQKDREICLELSEKHGYKYATYTYSNYQAETEELEESPFRDCFNTENLSSGYTCVLYKFVNGKPKVITTKKAETPLAARKETLASYAAFILGDKLTHNLGQSAIDGVRLLSIGQAAATGLPIISDYKPEELGEGLKQWLKKKGISQTTAAKLCNVAPRTFRRWVTGKPPIPRAAFELLQIKTSENK